MTPLFIMIGNNVKECALLLTYSPSDLSYEHVIDFEDEYNRYNYFVQQKGARFVYPNIPCDGYRTMFEVDLSIDDVLQYDYCVLSSGGDSYYYFITGRIQKGTISVLYVELDVFTTYYFDMMFNESFVDRCHVNRWTKEGLPTENFEDEGLEYGPSVIRRVETIKKPKLNFIISASSPIGVLKGGSSGGDSGGESGGGSSGGGSSPTSGDWTNGVPSKEMFRYLKGFEGYGPYLYNDSGGTPTIGYGITGSEPTEFNKLKGMQPCPESECAKICWDVLIRKYGKPIVNAVKKLGCTKQRQFDALLDLAYNGGTDLVINSSGNRDLANAIKRNPNDEAYIRPIWEKYWVSDGHSQQPGLVARRKAECNMFFGKPYEVRTIPKLGSGGNVIGEFKGDGWLPS